MDTFFQKNGSNYHNYKSCRIGVLSNKSPEFTALSFESTKLCVIQYIAYGWSGIIPPVCEKRAILLPPSKIKYLWGYPDKLAAHIQNKGGRVFLWTKHTPLNNYEASLNNGVGIVSGNLAGIKKAMK